MFLLSLCSHLKEQENKISVFDGFLIWTWQITVRANNIRENRKQKRKPVISREEVANEKVKTTNNLNTRTLLHRYFKDYLNMIDQQRKATFNGSRQQKWKKINPEKVFLRKGNKDNNMIRLDKAANGNLK